MRRISFLILLTGCLLGWRFLSATPLSAQENVPPTILSVITSSSAGGTNDSFPGGSINLISGTTTDLYLNGIVEDVNGRDTISGVFAVFHRSGVAGGDNCSADQTSCYIVNPCNLSNNADANQKVYSCGIYPNFIADSTATGGRYPSENWVAYVYVNDTGALFDQDNSVTKEINSLLSLFIPNTISFGSHSIGDVTVAGDNSEMVLGQKGNTEADVTVTMAANMGCQSGLIPRENLKWAITDVGYNHANSNSLTTSPVDTDLNVGYGSNSVPSPTKTLFWNISIPEAVGGNCSGTITLSTIAH